MNKTKFFCVGLSLLVCFACEKETLLDIPLPTTKLVVNSVLSAGKPAKVYVGKSNYALDTSAMYIENAHVTISNSSNTAIDTLWFTNDGYYKSTNQFVMGDTYYTMMVTVPEFDPVITTTYVPASVKFADYSFTNDAGIGRDGNKNKLLEVEFVDDIESINYYMLLLVWSSLDTIPMQGYVSNNEWYSYSPIIVAEGDEDQCVFSDELFNGSRVIIPMNFHFWNYEEWYDLSYRIKCYLVTLNEDYYKYHKSYKLYRESLNDIWQVNSQPQIYSNIENAFGVFSGINVADSIIINL
jgi:hypothetical protein